MNEHNTLKFAFENLAKKTETDLLSKDGTSIDARTGREISGESTDRVKRHHFSLGHEYNNADGPIQKSVTHVYFQNARTQNDRLRQSATSYRHETSESKAKTYGFTTDLTSVIESSIPQVLRYGASYSVMMCQITSIWIVRLMVRMRNKINILLILKTKLRLVMW